MMTELVKLFGPWGIAIAIMAYLLKVMVADKLKGIQETLSELVTDRNDHAERLVRMETTMQLNGCLSDVTCVPKRRAADA